MGELFTPRAVILDANGTMLDMGAMIRADKALGKQLGLDLTTGDITQHFGLSRKEFYPAVFGEGVDPDELHRRYTDLLVQFPRQATYGTAEALQRLRAAGILTGVATTSTSETATIGLQQAGLNPAELFDVQYFSEDAEQDAANRLPFLHSALGDLASRHGIVGAEVVFVGDQQSDALAAARVKVPFIGYRNLLLPSAVSVAGMRERRPEVIMNSMAELPPLLGIRGSV